jgi:hypothetical protein
MAISLICVSCGARTPPEQYKPTADQIRLLEGVLSAHPCVSDLRGWSRHYWINPENPHRLEFRLAMADGRSVYPGIQVFPTVAGTKFIDIQDAGVKVAAGEYDLSKRSLSLGYCGSNSFDQPPRR